MGDPGYPDDIRQYDSDPRSPNYNDPTETNDFLDKKEIMYREKVQDLNGYFLESISQAPDEWLEDLSELVLKWGAAPSDRTVDIEKAIGFMVAYRIDQYCNPTDDEVIEALDKDGGD